jgi:death-on-curing protein
MTVKLEIPKHIVSALKTLSLESPIKWVDSVVVEIIHDELINNYGGTPGIRDKSLLLSALSAGPQVQHYTRDASIAEIASAIGYGIISNHPFVDGNKRTALMVVNAFLNQNNIDLVAEDVAIVNTIISVASGASSKEEFALWLEMNTEPKDTFSPR